MKLPSNDNNSPPERNGQSNGHNNQQQALNSVPQNVHDEMVQGTLDAIFSSSEQTYEEFLECFSYFKPDVSGVASSTVVQGCPLDAQNIIQRLSGREFLPIQSVEGPLQNIPVESEPEALQDHKHTISQKRDDDELVEELLEEGTCSGDLLQRPRDLLSTSSLQVDNFVTLDSDLSDTSGDEAGTSYQASFMPEVITTNKEALNIQTDTKMEDHMKEISMEQLSLLSDDATITKTKKQLDDKSNVKYDVTLNAQKWEEFSKGVSDSEEEFVYNTALDGLNPGEIDEINDKSKMLNNETVLDFITTHRSEENARKNDQNDENNLGESDISNEVEAFKLDEDFHYDNVVLTPKFSPAEIQYLMDLFNQGNKSSHPDESTVADPENTIKSED